MPNKATSVVLGRSNRSTYGSDSTPRGSKLPAAASGKARLRAGVRAGENVNLVGHLSVTEL